MIGFLKIASSKLPHDAHLTGLHKLCARLRLCTQTALHMDENSCSLLIPLCENNLNLPMCSFFLPCGWLPLPLIHHVVMLATLLGCAELFVCFYRNLFCSPAINQISLSQIKVGFHSSYFADGKNIVKQAHWVYI